MAERKPRRNTRQRTVVLEELKKLSSHPTAAELYELARTRLPRISLGTVYRNLELLAQNGVIQKLQISGSEARFDGEAEGHHHVVCVHCGRIDDVHDLTEDFVRGEIRNLAGYHVVGFRLHFLGVCPECQGGCGADDDGGSPLERDYAR